MRLPFFKNDQKIWIGPLGILAFIVFYMIPNHINLFTPSYLPMFDFEKAIPFMDWTIWIYISDYIYIAIAFILFSDRDNMNKIYYSQIFLLFVSMIIFFIFPTTYPRPGIVEYSGFTGMVLNLLHSSDTPGNACPSVHVAMTFIAGFGFIKEKRPLLMIFMFWAILISVSTITIKQHYVVDVIGGFLMAIIFYYLGQRFIREK
ncbi:MAG: phosphatase PAP2 family protein [Proteobacteria bacterium]|nr:phosphatase PAP2 family protein [Pseudomonadota bacterium]